MNQNRIDIMKLRANILADIRSFFNGRGYIEADVPLLSPGVIPEAPIELFKTEQINPFGDSRDLFLLPSPEYYLKQLIAEGSGGIFSISRSFRNSEQQGHWHNPEFSMLEYYTMDATYLESITVTEDFFSHLLKNSSFNNPGLAPPFQKLTMTEVFDRFASFDLSNHCTGELTPDEERSQLQSLAYKLGLTVSENYSWEELFNLIFVHQIEPNLPKNSPLVIYNYPAGIPALAKPAAEKGRLERWELYAGGIELANCYSEETDFNKVHTFFNNETAAKKNALVTVSSDMDWCEMYKKDFPRCSGTAIGVDRLIMILTGATTIEGVILFPFSDIVRRHRA